MEEQVQADTALLRQGKSYTMGVSPSAPRVWPPIDERFGPILFAKKIEYIGSRKISITKKYYVNDFYRFQLPSDLDQGVEHSCDF